MSSKINLLIKRIELNKTKGQGLVEILVAIGILTIISVSALALAASSLKMAILSEEKMQATNLAQQAIEVVRNIRDNNWKDGNPWDNSFTTNGWYKVEYKNIESKWIVSPISPPPSADIIDGRFKRMILIQNISAGNPSNVPAKEIMVLIKWRSDTKEIKLTSYLTDWKPAWTP